MYSKKFYTEGCPKCGSGIKQINGVYVCEACNIYAAYNNEESDRYEMYEPLGYLAPSTTNHMRKILIELTNSFWIYKRGLEVGDETRFIAPINHIFNEYLVKVMYLGNKEYGLPRDKNEVYTKVFMIDFSKYGMFLPEEFEQVSNKEKTMVWLSQELGIKANEFAIGLLTEKQLERAIEICYEKKRYVNSITSGNTI